jgi:hypothetical protein
MKVSIILFTLFSMINMQAQDFEGVIKYTTNVEAPDQKTSFDFVVKIRKTDGAVTITTDGEVSFEALYAKNEGKVFVINRKEKQYIRLAPIDISVDGSQGETVKPEITKTNETQNIMGHICVKYISKTSVFESMVLITNYWVAQDIKDIDYNIISKLGSDNGESTYPPEINKDGGFPLMVESVTMRKNVIESKTVTKVNSLKKEPLNPSDFVIPAGFTEVKM